jgi:hypothetical protein
VTATPLSVKCRIGAHQRFNDDGSVPEDTYDTLHQFIGKNDIQLLNLHAINFLTRFFICMKSQLCM